MARRRTDRSPRRRLKPDRGLDLTSTLPDELLLHVLSRLDTRRAIGTAVLSRRWARLRRELPVLDFRVGNLLPPRYHRWILLRRDIDTKGSHCLYRRHALQLELVPNIRRYERRAMRALTRSVERFLDGDVGVARPRSVSRLKLEFFPTHNANCINRLIAKSIDDFGVSDLEAVAKRIHGDRSVHAFPSHGLCQKPGTSCLRRLKLGCCVLPPLHEFSALTTLVLQDLPRSTPAEAYEGVFTSCLQLQVLHLVSCACRENSYVVVDASSSEIKELVVDKCAFAYMSLRVLPNLESLASLDTDVLFESASFPCLRRWNITQSVGAMFRSAEGTQMRYFGHQHELGWFFWWTPDITSLVVRFTGPLRWIIPPRSSSLSWPFLPKLRKLLVADVPSSWDVSWPRLLLETAPSLEALHIHIAPCKEPPGDKIPWKRSRLRHHCLKEFVVAGFEGTAERQICLVRFVIGVSRLRRVALFKKGHAQEMGHWDWEMVTEQNSWTDEEKDATLEQIMDGISFSSHPVQFLLG